MTIPFRRRAALLLCLSLLSGAFFAGCGASAPTPGADPSAVSSLPEGTGEESFALPEEDLENYEFTVYEVGFRTGGYINDFADSGSGAPVLDRAIRERNAAVEASLRVRLSAVQKNATSTTGSAQGYGELQKLRATGDAPYDAAVLPAYDVTKNAAGGDLTDLLTVSGLNVTSPWWDRRSVDAFTVKGMLFFMTGDFSLDIFDATAVIAFNKKLANERGVPDLYALAESGKWTIDRWMEATALISEDLDGDSRFTDRDRYGSIVCDDSVYAVVNGAGERCAAVDPASGDLCLTLGTERTAAAFRRYVEFSRQNCVLRFQQKFNQDGTAVNNSASYHDRTMFPDDQALFLIAPLGEVSLFRDTDTPYGILPVFKLDEEQESYQANVSPFNARFLCVPAVQKEQDLAGRILETVGYFSSQFIPAAYYEKTLTGSKARDGESRPILELLRVSRAFDLGLFYQPADINKQLIYQFRQGDSDWASVYAAYSDQAAAALGKIDLAFDALKKQ